MLNSAKGAVPNHVDEYNNFMAELTGEPVPESKASTNAGTAPPPGLGMSGEGSGNNASVNAYGTPQGGRGHAGGGRGMPQQQAPLMQMPSGPISVTHS